MIQEQYPIPKIFVVFGMPRSGTTFLHHTLQSHPGIFVPFRKESYYFTANYDKGLAWFSSMYSDQSATQIGADINPMYYLDPQAIERISAFNPDMKVILGVRKPVDFAISLYGNMLAHKLQVGRITEVIRGYEWELTPDSKLHFELPGDFLERKIIELKSAFGHNLMLYDFAYFDSQPITVLQSIESFLDLEPHFTLDNVKNVKINASGRRDVMLLNRLVTNQRLLDLIYSVLPKDAIRVLRRWYERMSVRSDSGAASSAPSNQVTPEERLQLENLFSTDTDFYERLFSEHPIVNGDGEPLDGARAKLSVPY